ncbi:MAG: hypothetical protein DRG50_01420 [Deltaproteobacteria bacterium]|nr:MAG: hypothetical protein DRG50_01420 [Deltaproteobacteria bacterium]
MKKFFLGIVIGIFIIFAFIYFGGGKTLKSVGKKTIELGERIEVYEKTLKEATQGLIKKKEEIEKEVIKK